MKFIIMGHFLLQNIRILKKWKKLLEMSYFYMCVKVWHILPFFSPLTTSKTKIWKNVKNIRRYYPLCIMSKDHMMHDSWDIRCDEQMWWKNEKITQRYYHFTLVYHKRWSFYVWFLRYKVWQTDEMKKWEKNTWKYYHFTLVYHKRWSYDVWFLRYQVWQTKCFVNLDYFLPFNPTNNLKNQNFD